MTRPQQLADRYTRENLEAASIIVAQPERYPGLMQEWAQLIVQRPTEGTEPARPWRCVA